MGLPITHLSITHTQNTESPNCPTQTKWRNMPDSPTKKEAHGPPLQPSNAPQNLARRLEDLSEVFPLQEHLTRGMSPSKQWDKQWEIFESVHRPSPFQWLIHGYHMFGGFSTLSINGISGVLFGSRLNTHHWFPGFPTCRRVHVSNLRVLYFSTSSLLQPHLSLSIHIHHSKNQKLVQPHKPLRYIYIHITIYIYIYVYMYYNIYI